MFPWKTYKQMVDICKDLPDGEFKKKLLHIGEMTGIENMDKRNRWFGYCQKGGEIMGLWTLDWVIEQIREEKKIRLEKMNAEFHKKRIFKF